RCRSGRAEKVRGGLSARLPPNGRVRVRPCIPSFDAERGPAASGQGGESRWPIAVHPQGSGQRDAARLHPPATPPKETEGGGRMTPLGGQRQFAFAEPRPAPAAGTECGPPCLKCGGTTAVSPGVGPHHAKATCTDPDCRVWRWLPKDWKDRRPA